MASTTSRVAARTRARNVLADRQAERRKRDERIEAAMTQYFTAQDALDRARTESGAAVAALLAEGESRTSVAEMLEVTTREVKRALDDAPGADTGPGDDDTASADDKRTSHDTSDGGSAESP